MRCDFCNLASYFVRYALWRYYMTRYIHVYFQFEDPESHDDDYNTGSIVVKVVTLIQKAAADEIYNTSYCRVFHSILDQHLSTMAQGITSA
jgi:hypothetical protein